LEDAFLLDVVVNGMEEFAFDSGFSFVNFDGFDCLAIPALSQGSEIFAQEVVFDIDNSSSAQIRAVLLKEEGSSPGDVGILNGLGELFVDIASLKESESAMLAMRIKYDKGKGTQSVFEGF
jgi:hypothetical protein